MLKAFSLAAMVAVLAPVLAAGGVSWETNYDAAVKKAKDEKKKLFIEFTAEW